MDMIMQISSSMILFITLVASVLMVCFVFTCYRFVSILFPKEHRRDIFVADNRTALRRHTNTSWPMTAPKQRQWEPPPAYKDNGPPPPYSLVVNGPGIQQPRTGALSSETTLAM
ncbi:uncharacterized protein LOC111870808 isoform X1 [Cryptotermes secundus]|uniref:uncharacterized protein LOC111870808 isoform X1 n=1 Tax=Cryptotermes secundus TaxID=105785 RepID=UPI000CD7DC06|nr:uncharacterized protein LOC111870808 isoform X1 [Cryptotermes secundus]